MTLHDWGQTADGLATSCQSPTLRSHTVSLLSDVQHLGRLGEPDHEFKRVYTFLQYNEPHRVAAVVKDLLAAFERGNHESPAKYNAWNYVVGAFDLWLCRARVFYTAAGLIEGALKARLDTRLQDTFGEEWPNKEEAVPSAVLKLAKSAAENDRLGAIRRQIEEWRIDDADETAAIHDALKNILLVENPPPTTGPDFLRALDLGQLRTFFQTKRLWNKGPKLETLFLDATSGAPPLRSQLDEALETVHALRNDVAHYRPNSDPSAKSPSFTNGLFALAKMATWMDVDIQHFYGSVDTRHATELSLLIEDPGLILQTKAKHGCKSGACAIGEPFSFLLAEAPREAAAFVPGLGDYACLYHRVQLRVALHRPQGE